MKSESKMKSRSKMKSGRRRERRMMIGLHGQSRSLFAK
jgi:ribosomal protein L44E